MRLFHRTAFAGLTALESFPKGLAPDFRTIRNDAASKLPADLFSHEQVLIQKQELDVFSNPHTNEIVERLGDEAEFVVFGVVTEYCVHFAAKGLLDRGRKVFVVTDAIETLKAEESGRALRRTESMGAQFLTTEEAVRIGHCPVICEKLAGPIGRYEIARAN